MWLDAKTNLLHYRNFIEIKTPIMTDKDDNGVKPPSEDSHLKYLAHVQEQLNEQGKEEPDPILSKVPAGRGNQYTRQWEQWQKDYMQKK